MKPVNNPGFKMIKGSFVALLLVIWSQLLMACGSDSTPTQNVLAVPPQGTPTVTSQVVTATPSVTSTTATPKITTKKVSLNEFTATARVTGTIPPTIAATPTLADIAQRGLFSYIPTTQIEQAKQQWLQLIELNEKLWKAKNVTSYQIAVSYHNTPWPPGELYDLTVRNGQVVQTSYSLVKCQSCGDKTLPTPNPATRTYKDDAAFSVPGLFELSRSSIKNNWANDNRAFNVEFDANYGFPKRIILEQHHGTDFGIYWMVESFKELP